MHFDAVRHDRGGLERAFEGKGHGDPKAEVADVAAAIEPFSPGWRAFRRPG